MANEYLKRTHTSSGNYKVATFSLWMKGQEIGSTQQKPIYFYDGATLFQVLFERSTGTHPGSLLVYSSSTDLRFGGLYRDVSSWMNLVVNVDTTKSESNRISVYLNGSKLDLVGSQTSNTPNYPAENAELLSSVQTINALTGQGSYEVFDYFYVDGQTLTPDVFGYYKKGDGYISVGSTQATDFKRGQWVPKAPKVIKSVINARGGFGVNGFYLPMNDDSNFGADFHCEPNSIIKLKGEDFNEYPQPRNGAPTTTDAYVSQLREDPFKDYLVLAMPGISTSTSSSVVTNGDFYTDVSGWTAESNATLTHSDGALRITVTATAGATQTVSVVDGKRYTLTFRARTDGTNFTNFQLLHSGGTTDYFGENISSTDWAIYSASFVANGTSITLKPYKATGGWVEYDYIIFKQEDAPKDYSADIKGSGTNKTITPITGSYAEPAVTYNIPSYYGSAVEMSNVTGQGLLLGWGEGLADYNFGTGDFTMEAWVYTDSTPGGYWGIFRSKNYNDGVASPEAGIAFYGLSGALRIWDRDGDFSDLYGGSIGSIPNQQWTHVAVVRHNGRLLTFCNGVCVGNIANVANYTNNGFQIGQTYRWDGYIKDARIYKGVAKYTSGFDVPKPYTPVGISTWRAVSDTTANNFATLNPLAVGEGGQTYSEGNLKFVADSSSAWHGTVSTIGVSTGKWYVELLPTSVNSGYAAGFPMTQSPRHPGTGSFGDAESDTGIGFALNGSVYTQGSATNKTNSGYSQGDYIGLALDLDNRTVDIYANGSDIGGATSIDEGTYYFGSGSYTQSTTIYNFGQNPTFSGNTTAGTYTDSNGKGLFKYQPPSGFLALCEDNLPTPAIKNPGEHFKTVLYTGDGSNGKNITGVRFKPDLVWIKNRTTAAHCLVDSVRGATLRLKSDTTTGDLDESVVKSFNDDGFTVSIGSGTQTATNDNGDTCVAWCWKAGGPAVENTDGSITSQVSANQDAGFSIVSYTGNATESTVGHGLNKTPGFIIVKKGNGASDWPVYHQSLATQEYLVLNLTNAKNTTTELFYQDPTSSVFYIGDASNAINSSGGTYIAYCWAEIEGFSKFGSYVGNASADGPFVYCGFKPAWVMIKCSTVSSNAWVLYDNARGSNNVNYLKLGANLNVEENEVANLGNSTSQGVDFLSNGFKIRTTGVNHNNDGETYIFAAFAESPFQTANAK